MAFIEDESTGKLQYPMPPIPTGAYSMSPSLQGPEVIVENVIGGRKVSALQKHLYAASRNAARTALQKHTADESSERVLSAISCGGTVEYLIRSLISCHDPVLLAERGNNVESVWKNFS